MVLFTWTYIGHTTTDISYSSMPKTEGILIQKMHLQVLAIGEVNKYSPLNASELQLPWRDKSE